MPCIGCLRWKPLHSFTLHAPSYAITTTQAACLDEVHTFDQWLCKLREIALPVFFYILLCWQMKDEIGPIPWNFVQTTNNSILVRPLRIHIISEVISHPFICKSTNYQLLTEFWIRCALKFTCLQCYKTVIYFWNILCPAPGVLGITYKDQSGARLTVLLLPPV